MPGSLHGYVVRSGSAQPVAGAAVLGCPQPRVSADPPPAQIRGLTDGAGRFMFDDLRQGAWLVRVEGAGGRTLAKAVVHVLNSALSEVTIPVDEPGYPPRPPAPPGRPPRPEPEPGDPDPVASTGSIRGRVVNAASDRPIADATITVVFGSGPAPDIAPLTDEEGWFALDDLPSGRWRLRAATPKGDTGEAAVEVFGNALSEVTIEIDGFGGPGWEDPLRPPGPDIAPEPSGFGNVRGWVLRAGTGEPVADCAMSAEGGPGMRSPAIPNSDDAGRFDFRNALMAGDWVVRAAAPDGACGETAVRVFPDEASEITVEVESASAPRPGRPPVRPRLKTGSVRGRVVRASNGEPFGEATVMVVRGPAPAPDVAPLTDREGWFVIDDLPEGDWLLRAVGPHGEVGEATAHVLAGALNEVVIAFGRERRREPPGRSPPGRTAPEKTAPEKTAPARTAAKRRRAVTGTVQGKVVNAETGAPVADASITVSGGPGQAPDIAPLTAEDGSFVLDGLAPGAWRIAARGPDGESGTASATVTAGATARVVVKATPRPRPRPEKGGRGRLKPRG